MGDGGWDIGNGRWEMGNGRWVMAGKKTGRQFGGGGRKAI